MDNNFLRSRIVLIIALIVLVPGLVILMVLSLGGNVGNTEEAQKKRMQDYVDKFNQRNVDLIFYQKDPIVPENLQARRVNALNDQGLALNLFSDKAYHVIILDDLDGSILLNDQDIQKLKDLLINQHFRIVYLGTIHYEQLVQGEILTKGINHKEGTKTYLAYYNKSNMHSSVEGTAFADDPSMMPIVGGLSEEETIIYTVIVDLAHKDLYWT